MSAAGRPTPAQAVAAECARRGPAEVVGHCRAILDGKSPDPSFLVALAGAHGRAVLEGREGGEAGYWPRVWAARALLYVWDEVATDAVVRATRDDAWRVREMALKVIRRRRLHEGVAASLAARDDTVARVRAAAERALSALAT